MTEPSSECSLCPRLHTYRQDNRKSIPHGFNAPVPSFGNADAELLIVGLAPGLNGANTTGRPFTGDYAGDLLYATLLKFGFAQGDYLAHANDGLTLVNARITNAVRCVPPQNKPTTTEINTCRRFLEATLEEMPALKIIIALGQIAHQSVVKAYQAPQKQHPFAHGAITQLANKTLISSYHCSRYNTNTGRLTQEMFEDVFKHAQTKLNS